jgi:hypothetical protein
MMNNIKKQDGAVLIIGLVFMLLITVVATSSMRSSTLNVLMSMNDQIRVEATEKAQSIIDLVIDGNKSQTFSGDLDIGEANCSANASDNACVQYSLSIYGPSVSTGDGEEISYMVKRSYNATPRLTEEEASSSNFHIFEIYGEYDGRDVREGWSRIVQGVMVSSESGTGQGGQESL